MESFGVIRVLSTSLRLFVHNFVPFLIVALAVYAPTFFVRQSMSGEDASFYMLGIGVLLDSLIAAAVTYGVIMDLHGTRPSYTDCIFIGLRRVPAVIGVVVLSFMAIGAGLIFLVIPGIILALMLFVAIPVAVVERPGLLDSLHRSQELTTGSKGSLFLILIAIWVGKAALGRMLLDLLDGAALHYVAIAGDALGGVFAAVTCAVAYTMLRADREGIKLPEIATAIASDRRGS